MEDRKGNYEQAAGDEELVGAVREKEVLSCGEKFSRCWTRWKYHAYHDNLYFYNSPNNWGKILSAFFGLYTFVTLFFIMCLELVIEFGVTILWIYFIIFAVVFLIIAAAVTIGHVERKQREMEMEVIPK